MFRGGVGIGDKMNNIDRELTMKSCRKNGQIIRPDKSIRAAPAQVTFNWNIFFESIASLLF